MIERDRADRRKRPQIVFEGRVVAVPCHYVQRRMIDLGGMELATPFDGHPGWRVLILEGRDRVLKSRGLARQLAPIGPRSAG